MKKIIIFVVIAVILAGMAVVLTRNKNSASAETAVTIPLSSVTVDHYLSDHERDIIMGTDKEKTISETLSGLDWINSAVVSINSAAVSISSDNSSVTAVLDISAELSQDETDTVLNIITKYFDGLKKEDVVLKDQNDNIIYPLTSAGK